MRVYSIVPAWVLAALMLSSALLLAAIGGALWYSNALVSALCLLVCLIDGLYGAMAVMSMFGGNEDGR